MASMPGIVIKIGVDAKNAISNLNKVERSLKRSLSPAEKFTGILKKMGPALGAAALAGGALAVKLGVDGVQAAIEDEASQSKLRTAIDNTTDATVEQTAAVEEYVDAAMRRTGLDDAAVRGSLARLLRSTKDITKAQQLNDAAMLVSLGTGKDYAQVAEAIAKAHDGNAGALKRIGVNIPSGKDIDLLAELNKQFSGSVAADAGTYAGKIRRVATAASELQEAFGAGVLEGGDGAGNQIAELTDALYEAQPAMEAFGETVGQLAIGLADTMTYLGPFVEKMNELNNMGDGILTDGTLATFFGKIVPGVKFLAGKATGNEAAATAAAIEYQGGRSGQRSPITAARNIELARAMARARTGVTYP